MPEVPLCIHCQKPINKQTEEYVVTNKEDQWKQENWLYAHVECQRAKSN